MIHACEDCAKERELTLRCPVSDGPFICYYCNMRNANAVYSRVGDGCLYNTVFLTALGIGMSLLLTFALLTVFIWLTNP